ncbi:hypothetical protein Bbelb_158730 [Branchiostoma belcheri]|nr:hypothetical protein Bbelb_158730 [Branchiostoma belcheri]
MKLFVCMLLVMIVVMATLIDDSEGWRRRRRRRRSGLQADTDAELREVMEEARALLEELNEQPEQLDARGMKDTDMDEILADQEVVTMPKMVTTPKMSVAMLESGWQITMKTGGKKRL